MTPLTTASPVTRFGDTGWEETGLEANASGDKLLKTRAMSTGFPLSVPPFDLFGLFVF